MMAAQDRTVIRQWSSIMSAIFDLLYREYCRARLAEMRLAEMRKQLLLSAESHEVPANCDAGHPGGSAGPDSGFGDDRTATQHESRHIH
jgi:hypothetical protein